MLSASDRSYIPQAINAPYRIVFFTWDEAIPLALGLLLGIIHDQLLVAACAVLTLVTLMRRYKQEETPQIWLQITYWLTGLRLFPSKHAAFPGHIRLWRI